MPPTRGADGSKRVLWRTYKPVVSSSRDPKKLALRGLRALSKLVRAATVHAALIQGVLAPLKAAACKSLDGYPFQRTPSVDPT